MSQTGLFKVIVNRGVPHIHDDLLPPPNDYALGSVIQCDCGMFFEREHWGNPYWQRITERKARRLIRKYEKEHK